MGKVPVTLNDIDLNTFVKKLKGMNEEQKEISIKNILKYINEIPWTLLSETELQSRIDKFYAEVTIFHYSPTNSQRSS